MKFTGAASDPDGTAVTYQWAFGDGASATTASPSHRYAAAGQVSGDPEGHLERCRRRRATPSRSRSVRRRRPRSARPPTGRCSPPARLLNFTGSGNDPGGRSAAARAAMEHRLPAQRPRPPRHVRHGYDLQLHGSDDGSRLHREYALSGHAHGHGCGRAHRDRGHHGAGRGRPWCNSAATRRPRLPSTTITQNLPFPLDTVIGFRHEHLGSGQRLRERDDAAVLLLERRRCSDAHDNRESGY